MLRYFPIVFLVCICSIVCQYQNQGEYNSNPRIPTNYINKGNNFGAFTNLNKNINNNYQLNGPQNIDWCSIQKKYCGKRLHIGCKTNYISEGNCSNANLIEVTDNLKELIVNRHNEYRSFLASGFLNGLPPAKKMQEMKWDVSLAYLARLHVQNCQFKHDQCRATPENHFAGQNLGAFSSKVFDTNIERGIRDMIKQWFKEIRYNPVSRTGSFTSPVDKTFGNFTAMVRENNNKIGCALIRFQETKNYKIRYLTMLTCNYAESNAIENAVYAVGKPCSGCEGKDSDPTMVCSRKYTNLCSKIEPKKITTEEEGNFFFRSSQ